MVFVDPAHRDDPIYVGTRVQFRATIQFTDGRGEVGVTTGIDWRSSNSNVAVISPTGELTALAPGLTIVSGSIAGINGGGEYAVWARAGMSIRGLLMDDEGRGVTGARIRDSRASIEVVSDAIGFFTLSGVVPLDSTFRRFINVISDNHDPLDTTIDPSWGDQRITLTLHVREGQTFARIQGGDVCAEHSYDRYYPGYRNMFTFTSQRGGPAGRYDGAAPFSIGIQSFVYRVSPSGVVIRYDSGGPVEPGFSYTWVYGGDFEYCRRPYDLIFQYQR